MPNDYAKMTADLVSRMSRPREHVLCSSCGASTPATATGLFRQCPACSADDCCDDIELEALVRTPRSSLSEVVCG